MASDDSAWVFDSLVGFLCGPIWSAPLLTFIEERSLIFESDTEDSEEYRKTYQAYKNLVDLLLSCYMEDIGITPEQFEHACTVNKNTKIPIQFQQSLFEQIWAANEYDIFKRMMIQKNLELQLQALNMLEQKFGLIPASLTCSSDGFPDDELVMEQIFHEIPEEEVANVELEKEHDRLTNQYQNEKAALEEALRVSVQLADSSESKEIQFEEEPKVEKDPEPAVKFSNLKLNKPLVQKEKKTLRFAQNDEESGNEEDIKKREEYLKARRDKLVALKKQARSQRLMTKERPSSARNIAEASLNGKKQLIQTNNQIDSSILQVRKAIFQQLKANLAIGKTNTKIVNKI